MFSLYRTCPSVCPIFENQVTSTSSQHKVKSENCITWILDIFLSSFICFSFQGACDLAVEKVLFSLSFKIDFSFTFQLFVFQVWEINYSSCRVGYHFLSQLKDLTKKQGTKEPQKLLFKFIVYLWFCLLCFLFQFPTWAKKLTILYWC